MEKGKIQSVTSDNNILQIKIVAEGNSMMGLISELSKNSMSINSYEIKGQDLEVITQLTELNRVQELLVGWQKNRRIEKFELNSSLTMVSLIGFAIDLNYQLMANISSTLGELEIVVHKMVAGATNLNILIEDQMQERAVKVLHDLI